MTSRPVRRPLIAVAAATLAACHPGSAGSETVELHHAWARATAAGQDVGGVFLTVGNAGAADDRLVGGSSAVARSVEIHATQMDGQVMRMRPQSGLDIPAGATVALEPGGTHLMLVGLKAPLATGTSFPLALDFAKAGRKEVQVKVLPIGASGPRGSGDE